jgi:hypothetical protein
MFETSVNNDKVIDFYKNADLPVSYSLATAVYTVMPNSTDFTEFLAEGKNGINFAVLDGLFYYHTPHDNYTNVNPSSIAHYGAQIIPLVEEFTTNSEYADVEYFDSNGNQVFFTVFPNVFIAYSETLGSVLHIVTIVALIGLFVFMLMTDKITVSKIVKSFAILVGLIIAVVLFGYIIANIVAWISRVPFDVTYIRTTIGGVPSFITLLLIALIVPYAYHKYTSDDDLRYSLIVGGLFINALLALLTGFALSGASFLFMIPAISMVIYLGLRTWCRKTVVKKIVVGLLLVMNIVIVLPILYSLYLALTIGGLLALNVILVFYLFTLTPLFIELYE